MAAEVEKVRVDKWLWAVRIFKSRSLASEVCKQGHVKLLGELKQQGSAGHSTSSQGLRSGQASQDVQAGRSAKTLKPSASVSIGDVLRVRRNGYDMRYQVDRLIAKRVGAPIAVTCYTDLTPPEELSKFDDWYIGKGNSEMRERGAGRPTKRERREIEHFKDFDSDFDWGWIDEEDED